MKTALTLAAVASLGLLAACGEKAAEPAATENTTTDAMASNDAMATDAMASNDAMAAGNDAMAAGNDAMAAGNDAMAATK